MFGRGEKHGLSGTRSVEVLYLFICDITKGNFTKQVKSGGILFMFYEFSDSVEIFWELKLSFWLNEPFQKNVQFLLPALFLLHFLGCPKF